MQFRTTLILLTAVLAVGLYIQFGERRRETTDERRAAARLALKIDPDQVNGLRIEQADALYVLSRSNRAWRLQSPVQANADATVVMRIIDTLSELRRSEIITAEEIRDLGIDPDSYGFASPRAVITLEEDGRRTTLLVGRDAPGGQQLYLKRQDIEDILVTGRDLIDTLPASVLDLRDRRLFPGQPGGIRRVELQSRAGTWYGARNEQDQWTLERPVYARGLASAIRQWLDGLYEFRVYDFVADSVAAGALYGFDEPVTQLALYTDPRAAPHVLKIGRTADAAGTTHYATIVGQEAVFTVQDALVGWLNPDTAAFRDSRLLPMPAMNIGAIIMTEGERTLQLARTTQDIWEVTTPKRFTADTVRVQRILSTWSGAKAETFIDLPVSETALTLPPLPADGGRMIRFARSAPEPGTAPLPGTNAPALLLRDDDVTIMIGSTNDAGSLLVAPADRAYLMETSPELLGLFSINPLDYRDPVVLSIDPAAIRRITQQVSGRETTVERTNGLFRTRSLQEVPDTAAIDGILLLASRLRAARLVEEDATELERYGLEEPVGMVVLGLSGTTGINRVLLIGATNGRGETFAMVQGSDLVFTLPTAAIDALLKPVANPLAPPPAPVPEATE